VSSIHTCNRIAGSVHGVHFGYVGLAGSATCSLSIFLRSEEYAGVRRACNWTLSRVHGGGGNKEEEGRVTRRRSQVPKGSGTERMGEVGYASDCDKGAGWGGTCRWASTRVSRSNVRSSSDGSWHLGEWRADGEEGRPTALLSGVGRRP